MTNWLPVAIIGFSLLTPAGTRLRNLIMSGELVPKEIAKNTQDDWKTSFQGDFDPQMFCHFNIISLSTVIIEGWQVIYKPIKIWVANKSPLHSFFYGTCFRSQVALNTRVSSQTRVLHTWYSAVTQTSRVPHPGLCPRGGQALSTLCPALSLASSEQDSREVKIRRLGDEQGEEIRKTESTKQYRMKYLCFWVSLRRFLETYSQCNESILLSEGSLNFLNNGLHIVTIKERTAPHGN